MSPLLPLLAALALAAGAHATAMSAGPALSAPGLSAPVAAPALGATAPRVLPGSALQPRDPDPDVAFDATDAPADLTKPLDGADPLDAVGRGAGVIAPVDQTGAQAPACSDGVDNDGDGLADFPNDPGCMTMGCVTEQPRCQDGIDTDQDGRIDFDGGASLNGGGPLAAPDPECLGAPWRDRERP